MSSLRLDNVEARFKETAETFEQFRVMAKETKSSFEKIKKIRSVDCNIVCVGVYHCMYKVLVLLCVFIFVVVFFLGGGGGFFETFFFFFLLFHIMFHSPSTYNHLFTLLCSHRCDRFNAAFEHVCTVIDVIYKVQAYITRYLSTSMYK